MTDFPDTIDIAFDKTALPNDGRCEPAPALAPRGSESARTIRLDPLRADFAARPLPPRRRLSPGPLGSLLLHSLPLLLMIAWPRAPVSISQPIPIQLVLEQPPPPAQQANATPPAASAQGRRASEDFAEAEAPKAEKGAADAPPPPREPQPLAAEIHAPTAAPSATAEPGHSEEPAASGPQPPEPQPPAGETQLVLVAPPPPPGPAAPKEQAPNQTALAAPPSPPKASPRKEPAVMRTPQPLGSEWPLPLHENHPPVARSAARIGPDAARDEYCAYALRLMLRHIDLLPLSYTGTRSGTTILAIRVLADGKINSLRIVHSSGYPDIDERVEKMVLAVGQLPPLPQWIQDQSTDFTFQLHFPHPLQR